jgi:rhodanese-related sulfurtransferase
MSTAFSTRHILLGLILVLNMWISHSAFAVEKLTPKQIAAEVKAGEAVLIDIRRPDEWQATGVAQSAMPLDMTSENFLNDLQKVISRNPNKKVALICQGGVRSARLASTLEAAGLKKVIDVVGGMGGNGTHPGWIGEGLPVSRP